MKEYTGWLTSPSLIKRSLAVLGHYIVGYFIVMISVAVPVTILIVIFS